MNSSTTTASLASTLAPLSHRNLKLGLRVDWTFVGGSVSEGKNTARRRSRGFALREKRFVNGVHVWFRVRFERLPWSRRREAGWQFCVIFRGLPEIKSLLQTFPLLNSSLHLRSDDL